MAKALESRVDSFLRSQYQRAKSTGDYSFFGGNKNTARKNGTGKNPSSRAPVSLVAAIEQALIKTDMGLPEMPPRKIRQNALVIAANRRHITPTRNPRTKQPSKGRKVISKDADWYSGQSKNDRLTKRLPAGARKLGVAAYYDCRPDSHLFASYASIESVRNELLLALKGESDKIGPIPLSCFYVIKRGKRWEMWVDLDTDSRFKGLGSRRAARQKARRKSKK